MTLTKTVDLIWIGHVMADSQATNSVSLGYGWAIR